MGQHYGCQTADSAEADRKRLHAYQERCLRNEKRQIQEPESTASVVQFVSPFRLQTRERHEQTDKRRTCADDECVSDDFCQIVRFA